MSLFC